MATSAEFKDFVLEQLEFSTSRYIFSARKMFGDYCIYVRDSNEPFSIPKHSFYSVMKHSLLSNTQNYPHF